MFRQARRRFLAFWVVTGLLTAVILAFFVVHDVTAQGGVSGGASSSTSVVTGTDVKCDTPGGSGTVKCIVHTHSYTSTTTSTKCVPGSYSAPTDNSSHCLGSTLTFTANKGKDIVGKTTTTYSSCTICGQAGPPSTAILHTLSSPTVKWTANGCGAVYAAGTTSTATFIVKGISTGVNKSSVVFLPDSSGHCDSGTCGSFNATFSSQGNTTNFTVVG